MDIRIERKDPLLLDVDVLVVSAFEGQKKLNGVAAVADQALGGIIKTMMADGGFTGKMGEQLVVQAHNKIGPKKILVVGLGKEKDLSNSGVRKIVAAVMKRAAHERAKRVAVAPLRRSQNSKALRNAAVVMAEGALLGGYRFLKYRGEEALEEHEKTRVEEIIFIAQTEAEARVLGDGVKEGQLQADATLFARDLVNTPASDMAPKHLVEAAKDIVAQSKSKRITLEVFDEKEAMKRGMGAFCAVAKGSDAPSYFIHLAYKPGKTKAKKVFLVGKGITFDSGGLSLKPAQYMENMKIDMAGAAAVLAIFSKMDELKPNAEIHGVIPATENMPSGKSYRPGDVAKALNGTTIEILNTDAEGRVVLADALSFAVQNKADIIIDLATLTGAVVVALGEDIAGLFGNSSKLTNDIKKAATEAGEVMWELPLYVEYAALLKSKVADIKNTGDRWGGSIVAALFLKEFVDDTPWVHLDIAGAAEATKETYPHQPIGATGFGVRTLIHWLKTLR